MKKLLSLPPNLVENFHAVTGADPEEWFCASDPDGRKVGSGGGTVALLEAWRDSGDAKAGIDKAIMVHACGESRRLPAYAPVGKILTPVPVFRWASGQKIDQTLLSLQMPLYEEILSRAPEKSRLLIASGDVYIDAGEPIEEVPEADVVCYGMWVEAERATNHGVFVVDRHDPSRLLFMLQKPTVDQLASLSTDNYFLMDAGVWLLSERAIDILSRRSHNGPDGEIGFYDLYTDFGSALGTSPSSTADPEISSLTVAIIPLNKGKFYHFGTSADLLTSTLALQSAVADQRLILQRKVKPHPSLFTQNCDNHYPLDSSNSNIWIENACVGRNWKLHSNHIITGVPDNDWHLELHANICLDIIPIGERGYAIRPYGYSDAMRGDVTSPSTLWMGRPISRWFEERDIEWKTSTDIQYAPLFPIVESIDKMESIIKWMVTDPSDDAARQSWIESSRLSASDISAQANLSRLFDSRRQHMADNLRLMAKNHNRSVFYQLDLADAATKMRFAPDPLPDSAPLIQRARNRMLRSVITGDEKESAKAFEELRRSVLSMVDNSNLRPRPTVQSDQIVWSRSPVRIDLAGGWTDTPPFSLTSGANVVNMAIELNGQPPLQAYVKPSARPEVVIRSIDMSASETITDYEHLADFHRVGSPFSIPKAALALAGFLPEFSPVSFPSLKAQLESFGSGIEITILSAVPSGSGLGTSSILASTVLAALSEFAGFGWDKSEICSRTLALEQLLTTGGGWQDQFGGVTAGLKLLQTDPGIIQDPVIRWLPDTIFTAQEYRPCHLLYYTGITRVAKNILAEIVKGMFLNKNETLRILEAMKIHALDMAEALQLSNFQRYGQLVANTWRQNLALDKGTNPPAVQSIISRIDDLCLAYKLPGAGGGGFLYMVAKDDDAASRIRRILTHDAPNARARFVDMSISKTGLQISKS